MDEREVEGSELTAIIASELRDAQTFDQSKRALALEYMRGEMRDLPSRPSGSQQTDRTVADAIAWTLPQTVRVFTASDQMVEFEATQPGGEQDAEEASEYTNYSFFRENDGYRILYNATYDSLLMGNGAACSYWEPEQAESRLFRDKTLEEIAVLMEEEGWEGAGIEPKPGKPRKMDMENPETGEPEEVEVPTLTVRLKRVEKRGQICDMTLKPENLFLNASATTIEEARMVAYLHDDKTRSDLMAMAEDYGWDKDEIAELAADNARNTNEVSDARNEDNRIVLDSPATKSGEFIDLYEVYVRADQDGDGEAELLRVWYAGDAGQGKVLGEAEEWEDDIPFTDIPCYPVPHRWEAESLFDRTADIQRVKTALLRNILDNMYAVGMPMREVEEGSVLNPDILISQKFGGVMWKKKGSNPIQPHVTPFIGDKLMLGLQYMDEVVTKRTGISRSTMALDPEALQNQTATAVQQQRDAGVSQIELVARNMAELGWVKYFAKRRNLAKKYIKEPVRVPSRNGDPEQPPMGMPDDPEMNAPAKPSKYRTVQPEKWSDNMACTINVGLGTGSRDRDMSMLQTIMNGQIGMADRLQAAGMADKAIEFIPKIRAAAVKVAESSGLRNPDEYYPPVTDDEVAKWKEAAAQPKPDPAVKLEEIKGQVALKVEEGKNAIKMQEAEINSAAQVRREEAQLAADMQTKEKDRQNALAIEQIKAWFNQQSDAQRLAWEREKHNDEMQFKYEQLASSEEQAEAKAEQGGDPKEGGKPKGKRPAGQRRQTSSERMIEQMAGLITSLTEAQNAPKEIVFNEEGRPVGVRPVMKKAG